MVALKPVPAAEAAAIIASVFAAGEAQDRMQAGDAYPHHNTIAAMRRFDLRLEEVDAWRALWHGRQYSSEEAAEIIRRSRPDSGAAQ